jgi:hypothetical protein
MKTVIKELKTGDKLYFEYIKAWVKKTHKHRSFQPAAFIIIVE